MTAERFSGFPSTFSRYNGASVDTFHLTQLERSTLRTQTQRGDVIPAGMVDRAHVSVSSAKPEIASETRDLLTALTNVSLTDGFCVNSDSGALGATHRFQERAECTTFAAGATHETYVSPAGFLKIDSLQASNEDEKGVRVSLMFQALYNGLVDPIVHNTGVDFASAPAPAFVSRFFLGPFYASGVQQRGLISVNIETGINFDAKMFDGAVFPTKGSIITRKPKITLTFAKLDNTAAVSMFGRPGANQVIYFVKDGGPSGRVAPNIAQHIAITATSSDTYDDETSFSENDDGTVSVVLLPFGPLGVNLTSTIP